ncbi:DNA topoisomerase III [Pasteurella testudinis]|uniref:DNA topoisomerase III n=1 Tax=Pasteurella testudinis TaxID=761 RepID=UPI004059F31A
MKLFLCEKPSQAQDIGRCLGATKRGEGFISTHDGSVVVTWAVGHLVGMASPEAYGEQYQRWELDTLPILPTQWQLVKNPKTTKQLNVIKILLKKAQLVVVATDADREGEVIARELLDLFVYRGPVQRLWLSALDEASVRKALQQLRPGEHTVPLYHAGLARARADWLVGMNLTRLVTVLSRMKGYQSVMNVGRVQSPTLALVVNRDREIANFIPKPYFTLSTSLQNQQQQMFNAAWVAPVDYCDEDGRCLSESLVQQAAADIERIGKATVVEVETKREKKSPPLAFGLSSLQVACGKHWGMGAQEVLDIAQSLYETHKATTYPRTDCEYLPESMFAEVKTVLQRLYDADHSLGAVIKSLNLTQKSRIWNDSKITAHHGIIPTTGKIDISKMSDKELKVYDLIRRHYLAQFLPHFEVDKTVAQLHVGQHHLIAAGKVVVVSGWQALFARQPTSEAESAEQGLPQLKKNEICTILDISAKSLKTTPPKHYTEADLISAMKNAARFVQDERLKKQLRETEGLGTEATRAGIISNLVTKGFCEIKQKKYMVATESGHALVDSLPAIIKDPGMTALWEQALNQIAEGKLSLSDFMTKQAQFIQQLVNSIRQSGVNLSGIQTKKCPECGKIMRKINHEKGSFWGCSGYPDCKHTESAAAKKGAGSRRKQENPSTNISQQLANLQRKIDR